MIVTNKGIKKTDRTSNVSYTVKSFGEKLVELRNEKGITQAESAELIGITRNSLSTYEHGTRCPSIDIAVNVANAYNVSLDYLFGTGYRSPRNNEYNMYDMGFSEEALNFLCLEKNRYYVDAILSDSRVQKICDMLYGSSYKPLINSYEMNYISKLIADLLYCILVDVTKDTYKLRPLFAEETKELLDAVNGCIEQLKREDHLLLTDFDEYENCHDTIQEELEKIKLLLENAPITNYNQAFQDGVYSAMELIAKGNLKLESLDEAWVKEEMKLDEYIKKIPLKRYAKMSVDEQFAEVRKMMKKDSGEQ